MTTSAPIHYDMGYTATEFASVLQGNFTGNNSPYNCHKLGSNSYSISHEDSPINIEISATQKSPRVLGAISLPVLLVSFNITGETDEQSALFFDKFFKYFHKGGG